MKKKVLVGLLGLIVAFCSTAQPIGSSQFIDQYGNLQTVGISFPGGPLEGAWFFTNNSVIPNSAKYVFVDTTAQAGTIILSMTPIWTNATTVNLGRSIVITKIDATGSAVNVVPWTNGPGAFWFGTNTITYKTSPISATLYTNVTTFTYTNSMSWTNQLQGYVVRWHPNGSNVIASLQP